jgi:hypothetical protein
VSPPPCNVPLRNFLGTPKLNEVAQNCAKHQSAWYFGFAVVLSIGLYYARRQYIKDAEKNQAVEPAVTPPLWVCFSPIAAAVVYALFSTVMAKGSVLAEQERLNTSGLSKHEYLNQRSQDDRSKFSGVLSLTGTLILASAALFGPYLRADR